MFTYMMDEKSKGKVKKHQRPAKSHKLMTNEEKLNRIRELEALLKSRNVVNNTEEPLLRMECVIVKEEDIKN